MRHRKPAPQQEIRSLAPGIAVTSEGLRVATADQITGNLNPIAIETLHCDGHSLTAKAVRLQLGMNKRRAIATVRAIAHQ